MEKINRKVSTLEKRKNIVNVPQLVRNCGLKSHSFGYCSLMLLRLRKTITKLY